uniref:Uncharacterized protein n=1 Tax=Anabas testudineus TaxID=64144 RepID=A0A3Q1J3T4_ANATE
ELSKSVYFCSLIKYCLTASALGVFGLSSESQAEDHIIIMSRPKQIQVYCTPVKPNILVCWATAMDTWRKQALEAVELNEKDDWARLREALKHVYEDLCWFFVAQPTTLAIVENLKYPGNLVDNKALNRLV